jgi:hypothetical protein
MYHIFIFLTLGSAFDKIYLEDGISERTSFFECYFLYFTIFMTYTIKIIMVISKRGAKINVAILYILRDFYRSESVDYLFTD